MSVYAIDKCTFMAILQIMQCVGQRVEVLQIDLALRLHHICCLVRPDCLRQYLDHSAALPERVSHLPAHSSF